MPLECALDGFHYVVKAKRLGDIGGGSGLQRFIDRLRIGISGNHENRRLRTPVYNEPAKTNARHARQPVINESNVKKTRLHQPDCSARALGAHTGELWRQQVEQERLNRRLVFDYKD